MKKIRFYDPDVGYENLWAEQDGNSLYVIRSIPYFVYDISVGDTVRAFEDENDQVLSFSEKISASGHTTIRVRPESFTLDETQGQDLLRALKVYGATAETLPPRLIAVDIPEKGNVGLITDFLSRNSIPWEWADQGSGS